MSSERAVVLRCTFCGKEFDKSELVRFRGALACRNCAQAQEVTKEFNERPFYMLASFGTLIGLFFVTMSVLEAQSFTPMQGDFYIPNMSLYFGGISITLVLQAPGLYALNRSEIHLVGLVCALAAFASAAAQLVAIWDLMTNGATYVINDMTYMKGFGYYAYTTATYTVFSIAAGIGVLLYMSNSRFDKTSISTGALYLLGGSLGVYSYLWPPIGFLHVIMYAVAFLFFFTSKNIVEPNPIETLDYRDVTG